MITSFQGTNNSFSSDYFPGNNFPISFSFDIIEVSKGGHIMIDIQKLLYEEAKRVISSWTEQDIYAISFFIYSNEEYRYKRLKNLTEFSIGYNTESYLKDSSPYSEKRWNFAFWPMNNEEIIDVGNGPDTANDNFHILLQWYLENNIKNPVKKVDMMSVQLDV